MATAPETRRQNEGRERPEADTDTKPGAAVGRAAETVSDMQGRSAEALRHSGERATEMTQEMAERGQETLRNGLNAAADVAGTFGRAGYEQSKRVIQGTAQATDIWREAGDRTAEDMRALMVTYSHIGQGVQKFQHAWFDLLNRHLERSSRKPQDLLRANSLEQMAEIQRDIYLDTVHTAIESTTELLDLAGKIAQDAVRPLRERGAQHRV